MRAGSRLAALVVLLLVPAIVADAEEQAALFSGPQVGETLPPLKVILAYGKDATQTVDFVELAAGRPSLFVFVNGSNRLAAELTRILMNFAEMRGEKLAAGVVHLTRDLSSAEQYLKQASTGWWVASPVGISLAGPEGPGTYGLNRNVNLTVVVAVNGVVTASFPLIQPSAPDAPKILKEVVAVAGGTVPTIPEVNFLSVPTYHGQNKNLPTGTTDVKLRELICAALAADDESAARSAASAIDEYVRDHKERQAELGLSMAPLLSTYRQSDNSNLPVFKQLQRWHKEYGPPEQAKRD